MIKLFTDSDLDGLGCGLVAKLAFKEEVDVSYCSYRNLNQRVAGFLHNPENHDFPIYITDLSVNEEVEKKLAARFKKGKPVQMVDHHVTALHFNDHEWGFVKTEYESGKKTSATSLFYEFLLEKNLIEPSKALEEFIELVRQYDTWEWDENNNVTAKRLNDLFFIIGIEQFEKDMLARLQEEPNSFSLNETENLILDMEEKKIERYIHMKNRQMIQAFIDEYCVGIVHAENYHSELGNALGKKNPHLDLIAIINVGNKKMGFRTIYDHVDVSAFAAKFGGGGHPKASGCSLTDETFKKFVVDVFDIEPRRPDADQNQYNITESEFGVWYENRKGEISHIRKIDGEKWEVLHDGKVLNKTFSTFEDAERFLKRYYVSWLQYDNQFIEQIARTHKVKEEKLRNHFTEEMKKIIKK